MFYTEVEADLHQVCCCWKLVKSTEVILGSKFQKVKGIGPAQLGQVMLTYLVPVLYGVWSLLQIDGHTLTHPSADNRDHLAVRRFQRPKLCRDLYQIEKYMGECMVMRFEMATISHCGNALLSCINFCLDNKIVLQF